jgi:hypothetical protein
LKYVHALSRKKKVLNQPQVGLELSGHELLAPITSNKNG